MERTRSFLRWVQLTILVACLPLAVASQEGYWNLKKYVSGPLSGLQFGFSNLDRTTGDVEVNGGDKDHPGTVFAFAWGDGQEDSGGFPHSHTYQDLTRNYVLKVTAHRTDGTTEEGEIPVIFASPEYTPKPLPPALSVTIPDHPVTLGSHVPNMQPPTDLLVFDDSSFPVMPRATVEYVLWAEAEVLENLVNGDHVLLDGEFPTAVLRNPKGPGNNQAFFFTTPLAVSIGDRVMNNPYPTNWGPTHWATICHEMGHNFQGNSPADYFVGAKLGGRTERLLSESVPRIFEVVVGYELVNDSERYGLGRVLALSVAKSTIDGVENYDLPAYQEYLSSGMPFCSYLTSIEKDEPYDTYSTLAMRFFIHAEEQGLGYRVPAKRMMKFMRTIDAEIRDKWEPDKDTASGAKFRSTFMVTAFSYAFQEDLREEFRALNFPVSDADYEELWQKADTDHADFLLSVTPATLAVPRGRTVTCTIATEAIEGLTHDISFRARMTSPIEGVSVTLSDRSVEPGGSVTITVTADAAAPLSTSSIRLQAEGEYTAHAADIPVTVITAPAISSASYAKKILTIQGTDFGTSPMVLVNVADRTAQITTATDTSISLKGKKKKLGLHSGENRLQVIDSAGTSSNEFALNL